MSRSATPFAGAAFAVALAGMFSTMAPVSGQTQTAKPPVPKPAARWVMPRTPDGKPDLQGNWTNETQTPLERMGAGGTTLTDDQARAIEQRAQLVEEYRDKASDPNRPAPPKGGEAGRLAAPGEQSFIEKNFGSGRRRRRRLQRLLAGSRTERDPHRRRRAQLDHHRSAERPHARAHGSGQEAARRDRRAHRKYGEFDHPEMRPLADRCLLSFGSNAGPPMLPNYFYNNNYTIVQTPDHIMIMAEMVHDVRIIRLNAKAHVSARNQPWLGDSIGRWEGDTLVVETTNIHPMQREQTSILWAYRGASENLKVTERFTRTGPDTIVYRFTMEDPDRVHRAVHRRAAVHEDRRNGLRVRVPRGQLRDDQHPVGRALEGARRRRRRRSSSSGGSEVRG